MVGAAPQHMTPRHVCKLILVQSLASSMLRVRQAFQGR